MSICTPSMTKINITGQVNLFYSVRPSCLQALMKSCENNTLPADTNIRLIALFDNEEVIFFIYAQL